MKKLEDEKALNKNLETENSRQKKENAESKAEIAK
jgi:hypothetical protein